MEKIDISKDTDDSITELINLINLYKGSIDSNNPDISIRLQLETKFSKYLEKSNINENLNFIIMLLQKYDKKAK